MGIRLEEFEIEGYRGILNLKIVNLGKRVTIVGPNSTNKSSVIHGLCLLGSNKMHEFSDLPGWVESSEVNLRDLSVKIHYLFKLTKNFKDLISDTRIVEFLSLLYDEEISRTKDEDYKETLSHYKNNLLYQGPLGNIFEDALYKAIREEVERYPNYEPYKPLFWSDDQFKLPKEIFREVNYLKITLELSHSSGPELWFSLLDDNKNPIVVDEVFYHWLNRQNVVDGSITLSLTLGSIFIKGIIGESSEDVILPKSVLAADGSNIQNFIEYCLESHPEVLEQTSNDFEKVFGKFIHFKKASPAESRKGRVLVKLEDDCWFSLMKLSDGMKHALRILLQLASCRDGDILVIDEPELHLHPGAVKRLRRVLIDTSNEKDIQIICSAHSPLFVDSVFADTVILNRSYDVQPEILDSLQIDQALTALGATGADILLYDGIIWVEGPSDKIYLERWLELMEPTLKQQIGVFFYGGKSHLEYIDVGSAKSLCRNAVFVIDGDLKSEKEDIGDKARRLLSDCQRHGLYCWVIKRRTIENCLPIEVLESAVRLDPGTLEISKYDDVFDKLRQVGRNCSKIELAKAVAPKITLEHIKRDEELYKELERLFSKLKSYITHLE